MDHVATQFEKYRARLFGVAYRMLGIRAEAEDMVQDAWLRWQHVDRGGVENPEAWLVTTVTRLCLDRLRRTKLEREGYAGPWLPEPILVDTLPSPEMRHELAQEVSIAFLALLERLGPDKRAAFLLREVFDYEYGEISIMLGKSEPTLRQLVHRAREEIKAGRPKFSIADEIHDRLLERFMAAATTGDRESLMKLLSEDAEYTSDGGGKVYAALRVLRGPERIGRLYQAIARNFPGLTYRLMRVNGETGVVNVHEGSVHSVLCFRIAADRICGIYSIRNPDKLRSIPLPGPLP